VLSPCITATLHQGLRVKRAAGTEECAKAYGRPARLFSLLRHCPVVLRLAEGLSEFRRSLRGWSALLMQYVGGRKIRKADPQEKAQGTPRRRLQLNDSFCLNVMVCNSGQGS
jgi:hypothetical protein